jgi:hypothetical protein
MVRVKLLFFLCNVAYSLVFHINCANADVMTMEENFHVDVILLKCLERSSACIQSYELLLFCFPSSYVKVKEKSTFYFVLSILVLVGRERSVGIVTRYGWMIQGLNPCRGRGSPQPSRPALGPTQPSIQLAPGLPGGKSAEMWR